MNELTASATALTLPDLHLKLPQGQGRSPTGIRRYSNNSQLNKFKMKDKIEPMSERKSLVMRTCKCGCRRKWKCYPDSKSVYFSYVECIRERQLTRLQFEDSASTRHFDKSLRAKKL